jgi:alpha-N-acetylglucosaminidase
LLDAADQAPRSDAYRFDLVSVTRQVLDNYSTDLHRGVVKAREDKDRQALQAASARFRELIRDLDALLATRPEFLLGTWLETAKRWGATKDERARMEWNARRVITMWGQQTHIRDYSRRSWSGMLTGFYGKRWEKFLAALDQALAAGAAFDEAAFDRGLQDWERSWADQRETYPTRPRGDALKVSRRLWEEYHQMLNKPSGTAPSDQTTGQPTK